MYSTVTLLCEWLYKGTITVKMQIYLAILLAFFSWYAFTRSALIRSASALASSSSSPKRSKSSSSSSSSDSLAAGAAYSKVLMPRTYLLVLLRSNLESLITEQLNTTASISIWWNRVGGTEFNKYNWTRNDNTEYISRAWLPLVRLYSLLA